MKEDNNSGNCKMDGFLASGLDSFSNILFKSPCKDIKAMNMESLPLSCKQTPIMSPLPSKFCIDKTDEREKTHVKKLKRDLKFTPLKGISSLKKIHVNSADKVNSIDKHSRVVLKEIQQNNSGEEKPNPIDYSLGKFSHSAEKNTKVVSRLPAEVKKERKPERSPLIPNKKIDDGLSSPESHQYGLDHIHDSDPANRSSSFNN